MLILTVGLAIQTIHALVAIVRVSMSLIFTIHKVWTASGPVKPVSSC